MEAIQDISLDTARQLDIADPLHELRNQFLFPRPNGEETIYFTGNSLGLQPVKARQYFMEELDDWARLGVEGHEHARHPWLPYHEPFSQLLATVAGGLPEELVAMGSLTANLHFMMISFYHPRGKRVKILCEKKSFPSDLYALRSQARLHGLNPDEVIVEVSPESGEYLISDEKIIQTIRDLGEELALVMIGGVNYFTGQLFDIPSITREAHAVGAFAGFDLAHAIGNVPLRLHKWEVDFAVWCTYKYLNSGPGAVGGYFIHQNHHGQYDIPRLEGWWGTDKNNRFQMKPEFEPIPTAEAWQHSNAPVFNMIAHRASLEIFREVGMDALVVKSRKLWDFMHACIEQLNEELGQKAVEVITPQEPHRHGCQLSLVVSGEARHIFSQLLPNGIIADWREPNIIRIAPVPLYNSFEDVFRFKETLRDIISAS